MIPAVRKLAPGMGNCLRVIPFGVDTDLFQPDERAQSVDGLRIVCTRVLEPLYDHETLLRAVGACVKKGLKFRLDLVGDGSLRGSLESLARELGISNHVAFLGRVSHQELAEMLSGYDVFVTASRSDGNNVSLNEAMASGVFPIASDIPANRQWITDGLNGHIFPVGDPQSLAALLERSFHDPDFRSVVARRNRNRVELVASWKHFAAEMDNLYAEVIGQCRRFDSSRSAT
jgi:glycosyltransferase involved in cell wall biosynthesis